jgi:glutamate/tyrosine decarboxylase-like PLP-dependent enzyme
LNQTTLGHLALNELRDSAARVQASVAGGPIVPSVTPGEIRSYLASRYDFTKALALDDVVADVEHMLGTWQVHVTHPRYFGLFNPSVSFASIVADTLAAMYNPQLATWRTSPAANEIERHTLMWLVEKFGLPKNIAANFTTGGAEANLSAVVVALTRAFPQYGTRGLRGLAATPTIYLAGEAHHSFNKIAHLTGLGRESLRRVATKPDLTMDVNDLERLLGDDRRNGYVPLMVVATAGTTGAGAIDPLPEVSALCRQQNLWFHVDAAWGGGAVISPALRRYLAGIDQADSITCDAHKWFSVPMGAGMFFCRHVDAVREAFHAETSYMPRITPGPVDDPYTSTVQWSRRFIGLKLFLALAQHGESGYGAMIEHQTRMGDLLRQYLKADGWQIVNSTPFPLVCFTRDGLNAGAYVAELLRRQIAWMSEVRLASAPPVIRACVTSFRTTETDVREVVREMRSLTESAVVAAQSK